DFTAKLLHRGRDEVVREWPGRLHAADAAVDARGLEDANHDREAALPIDLFQDDNLVFIDLADDDAAKFHLHGHGGLRLQFPVPAKNRTMPRARGRGTPRSFSFYTTPLNHDARRSCERVISPTRASRLARGR